MITVTFKIDRDEHGKIAINTQAIGMGDQQQVQLAELIYEGGAMAYQMYVKSMGGNPEFTEKQRINAPIGNG